MSILAQYNTLGFYTTKAARQWDRMIAEGGDYEAYRAFFQTRKMPAVELIVPPAFDPDDEDDEIPVVAATIQLLDSNDDPIGTAINMTVENESNYSRLIYLGGWINNLPPSTEEITTGAIQNGALYNWYSIKNTKQITTANAHIPTSVEFTALITAYGGESAAYNKLKAAGLTYWNTPNAGTNETGFDVRGSGFRNGSSASFSGLKDNAYFWTSTEDSPNGVCLYFDSSNLDFSPASKNVGMAVRLIVDFPLYINGNDAVYIGNDGQRYACKLLADNKWWTVESLCETKYRDGSIIPLLILAQQSTWENDTAGAMCYYGDDILNATTVEVTEIVTPGLTLEDGDYSLMITTQDEIFYSDIFGWTSDSDYLNDMLKVSCVSSDIRLGRNYLLNLTGFTFECYLNAIYLGINPEFEEEVSQRDGTQNVLYGSLVNQRQWDIDGCEYIFKFLLGLRVLESNGTVTLTWKGITYTANDIMAEKTEDHFTELMQIKLSVTDINEIVSVYNEIN